MSNSRRKFVKQTVLASMAFWSLKYFGAENNNATPENSALTNPNFFLPKLPYAYNALEPFIDEMTMEIHHSKHHNAYVTNLNKALTNYKTSFKDIAQLCAQITTKTETAIRNNAGGHYNHSLFWELMMANMNKDMMNAPTGNILAAIERLFGNFEAFKKQFEETALKRFGSGWAWLYEVKGQLKIGSTPNQDNPLMPLSEIKGKPLLALDVWEHAYYLKYQNKRAEYINNWWNLVNWEKVNELYSAKK
jgi:superoxide dismutase, Fe-Mn family